MTANSLSVCIVLSSFELCLFISLLITSKVFEDQGGIRKVKHADCVFMLSFYLIKLNMIKLKLKCRNNHNKVLFIDLACQGNNLNVL